MGERRKVLAVIASRPDAIKMAPICLALKRAPDFETVVVATGQHREQLDPMLAHFGLVPDHDLAIMRPRQTLSEVIWRSIEGIDRVVSQERPDAVLVHGDTAAVVPGSLVAFHHRIPVVHVEAGLRSGDRTRPFPEEMYRRIGDLIADAHLAPTGHNRRQLLSEGVPPERIYVTGNSVIDAVAYTLRADHRFGRPELAQWLGDGRPIILVTAHRREHLGAAHEQMFLALRDVVVRWPEVRIVYPVHLNPAVREMAEAVLGGCPGVELTEPLGYGDMINFMARCHLVLSDSGGLQEEAPFLGKPMLLMRDTTERPEAIEAGTVRLVGTSRERIAAAVDELLGDPAAYNRMARAASPFGDGRASERTVAALRHLLGLSDERPADFAPAPALHN